MPRAKRSTPTLLETARWTTPPDHKQYIRSVEWQELKDRKRMVCPEECVACGKQFGLNLHHMRYAEDLRNTSVMDVCWLCDRHHELFHKYSCQQLIHYKWDFDTEYLIRETLKWLRWCEEQEAMIR